MNCYLSLSGECQTSKIIEKSKFIATSRHVCGEEEAKAFISEIRSRYPDATHNCYAYVADSLGNFPRFSDDGEPQGTAGMPMLEVLKAQKLFEAAIVVTRYFGGIKLGAGGLVRAYSGAVAENLSKAQRVMYEPCVRGVYGLSYPDIDAALRYFSERNAQVLNSEYASGAQFTLAVKKREEEEFDAGLKNALNGRVSIKKECEYFHPFPI